MLLHRARVSTNRLGRAFLVTCRRPARARTALRRLRHRSESVTPAILIAPPPLLPTGFCEEKAVRGESGERTAGQLCELFPFPGKRGEVRGVAPARGTLRGPCRSSQLGESFLRTDLNLSDWPGRQRLLPSRLQKRQSYSGDDICHVFIPTKERIEYSSTCPSYNHHSPVR